MSKLDTTGRVLTGWNPEEPENWSAPIAWRTLIITTYSMILAFCVWFLPSAIAPKLTEIGFTLTEGQLYWLAAMPGLACGLIRFIYMFLPPIVGTRRLVAYSSLLYALPMLGWFFAVRDSTTGYGVLLGLAFACGIGGGSFSGYMPSTGYFFPKRLAGTALGIQAGVGNMGMSIIQLMGPWLMGFGLFGITWIAPQQAKDGQVWVHNVAVFFVPWTIVAAILAFTLLKDVPVKANIRQQIDIFSNPDTWYMTLMYVATFGLFSGFAAQFGLLIKNTYGPSSELAATFDKSLLPLGATYAFLGPLIGSVIRMCWGPLCDKFGGAIWTFVSLIGMGATLAATTFFLHPTDPAQFPGFLWAMLAMFFFSGLGNAGTFKQMPMIMPKRQAGGAIGFTAAVASLGPFLVGIALTLMPTHVFFYSCAVFCVVCAVICWIRYAKPGAKRPG